MILMPPQAPPIPSRERFALSSMVTLGALLGTFIPYLMFLTPAPLAVLVFRHGLRAGISTAFFSSLLVGVASEQPFSMLIVLLILGLGVVFGEALRDGFNIRQTLMVGWLAMLIAQLMPYYVAPRLLGMDIMAETLTYWEQSMQKAMWWNNGASVGPEQAAKLVQQFKSILPAMIALFAAGIALINYWVTERWLRQLGEEIPKIPPFTYWRFPWYLAWVYIIGTGLSLLQSNWIAPLSRVVFNLQVVAGIIFFIQGLAITCFFLNKRRIRRFLKAFLLITGVVFLPIAYQLLVLTGLLDTWFDFRRSTFKKPPA